MIYKFFGFDATFDLFFLKQYLYVVLLGLFLNFLFSYFLNQFWLANFNSYIISSLIILSVFIITKVISNNIALSLGLVGALSIVRFRTPIKNPLELAYYFLLITFGITANVDLNLSLNLLIFISVSFIIFKMGTSLLNRLNLLDQILNIDKKFYLILTLKQKDKNVEDDESLVNFSKNENNEYTYHLSSDSKNSLLNLVDGYKEAEIKNFELRKATNFEGYL